MKNIKMFMMIMFMVPAIAFAQDAAIPTDQFLMYLLQSLGGLKGASALAIIGLVVQIIVKFLNSDLSNQVFKNFSGFGKLVSISALTIVSGVITLIIQGMSPLAAIFHSTTLAAIMVLVNQFAQQYKKQ